MTHFRSFFVPLILLVLFSGCSSGPGITLSPKEGRPFIIVYQPSHQTETGREFNEALVCNAIAEAAIASASGDVRVYKVWSYDVDTVHHARRGSNTKIEHTSAIIDGKISGYAYELIKSNEIKPDLFVSIHNNGATNRNACWGFVHEGDQHEATNREIARALVKAVCDVSGLEDAKDHGDSSPNRNDYRCLATGKLSFYSLDENVNKAPYRVLLEIGDNAVSRAVLTDPEFQRKMGKAIQTTIEGMIR